MAQIYASNEPISIPGSSFLNLFSFVELKTQGMKKGLFLLAIVIVSLSTHSKEGMWIPLLIKQYNEADMINLGMKISAEDLYHANKPSINDAICLFNGGCTAEVISDQGLILTNHHCGYGMIQSHSTMENDLLEHGFWAESFEKELPNKSASVTFIRRIEDISDIVLKDIELDTPEQERVERVQFRIDSIRDTLMKSQEFDIDIKPFYHGNQYFMYFTEKFEDIRLVGAPPSSIGKYGFDTDNWVWPRHNADFSLFRIYASSDNEPAPFDTANRPYRPVHHLKVDLRGVKEGDFSMVYGFPYRTDEYLPSFAVDYLVEKSNPARISMRDKSLSVINKAMRENKMINLQYASKQSRISNAWKKWKGQVWGLKRTDAVDKKLEWEENFARSLAEDPEKQELYGSLLEDYRKTYDEYKPYEMARGMLIEYYYYGPEILRFAQRFKPLLNEELSNEEWASQKDKIARGMVKYFKDYNAGVDAQLMQVMTPQYIKNQDDVMVSSTVKELYEDEIHDLFKNSLFASQAGVDKLLAMSRKKAIKKIGNDPAFLVSDDILKNYKNQVQPRYNDLNGSIDSLRRTYMHALMEVMPDAKHYYPDANFSIRVTYGKVEGYNPGDAVEYGYYTTLEGVIQKMDSTSYEYKLPKKLVELYQSRDYGDYTRKDGSMPVCYIGSNHTSGGNSGSPALNAEGNLVGLNFDRTWETTMSDINYDRGICRNIMVDVRYILFIIDKYAGADHLIEEMEIVKN
jgi:hypothetical protein